MPALTMAYEASVIFWEKGSAVRKVKPFFHMKKLQAKRTCRDVVRVLLQDLIKNVVKVSVSNAPQAHNHKKVVMSQRRY